MEPELQRSEFAEASESGVTPEQGGSLAPASAPTEGDTQWQQILEQVYEILSGLPEYIGKFYGQYRQPIVTVGLIVAALVSVKLVLALLSAINEIPLLAPSFELIGLGYGGWFIYRYLLRASSRQELYDEFKVLKDQVIGQKSSDS